MLHHFFFIYISLVLVINSFWLFLNVHYSPRKKQKKEWCRINPFVRPLIMLSETSIEKAGFRSVIFPTGLRIATRIVRRIEYPVLVFFLETRRRLT